MGTCKDRTVVAWHAAPSHGSCDPAESLRRLACAPDVHQVTAALDPPGELTLSEAGARSLRRGLCGVSCRASRQHDLRDATRPRRPRAPGTAGAPRAGGAA